MKNIQLFLVLLLTGLMSCSSTDAGKKLPALLLDGEKKTYQIFSDTLTHDTLTIAMVGDIMMGTTYPDTALPVNNGRNLFRDVKPILKRAHLALGNLEGTLCEVDSTTKEDSPNQYAFRTPPSYGGYLKECGFDFLSMANNHAFDFGEDGVEQTESVLDSLGISYAGLQGRAEYRILKRGNLRIGFCAFGHNPYTVLHTDSAMVERTINQVKPLVDLLVVSFHGGAEGRTQSHLPYGKEEFFKENRGTLRDFAHYCIDLGADVVYGHGPHVVRCVEVYKNRFIAYSLGNFCTPKGISLKGISGHAPVVEIRINREGQFVDGKIHSFIQQWAVGPRKDSKRQAALQIRSLSLSDVPNSQAIVDSRGNIRLKK